MAHGSTCPESSNKEEYHQGAAGARFYSWKVLLLRAIRMFLWTVVLPFCIHETIATNTSMKEDYQKVYTADIYALLFGKFGKQTNTEFFKNPTKI